MRDSLFILLQRLKGGGFTKQWRTTKAIRSEKDLSICNQYLREALLAAFHNVPYYHNIFGQTMLNEKKLNFEKFDSTPLLAKDTIRKQGESLASIDYTRRKWYYNSSGGSTGEPIRFIRDKLSDKWTEATLKYYYENIIGIDELRIRKIVLWGSERDIFKGTMGYQAKITNWLSNQKLLNSFRMTQTDMEHYVKIINSYKPELIRGYVSSLYELCKFVERNKLSIHRPKIVVSGAEKLRKEAREKIESIFQTKVYDLYGSREVPAIAGECKSGLLHIFTFNNYLEVLDSMNRPVKEGEMGRIILTQLHNYSMPLIRYDIGDLGIPGPSRCTCGNPLPTLKEINGRVSDHFVKQDGTIIHGEYFTHLFYLKDFVKAFQVRQEDYKRIRILVVLQRQLDSVSKYDIENKIKLVMGQDCTVIWEFVDTIPETKSGKYIYTKSLLYS